MYTIKIYKFNGFMVNDGNREIVPIRYNAIRSRFDLQGFNLHFSNLLYTEFSMEGIQGTYSYDDIVEIFDLMSERIKEQEIDRFYYFVERNHNKPYLIDLKITDGEFTTVSSFPEQDIDKVMTALRGWKREKGFQ